jgi:hypothetical protein
MGTRLASGSRRAPPAGSALGGPLGLVGARPCPGALSAPGGAAWRGGSAGRADRARSLLSIYSSRSGAPAGRTARRARPVDGLDLHAVALPLDGRHGRGGRAVLPGRGDPRRGVERRLRPRLLQRPHGGEGGPLSRPHRRRAPGARRAGDPPPAARRGARRRARRRDGKADRRPSRQPAPPRLRARRRDLLGRLRAAAPLAGRRRRRRLRPLARRLLRRRRRATSPRTTSGRSSKSRWARSTSRRSWTA